MVVNSLVTPAILGVDILQGNCLSLDFSQTPVAVCSGHNPSGNGNIAMAQVLPIYEAAQANLNYTCALPTEGEIQNDVIDECAVPSYINSPKKNYQIVLSLSLRPLWKSTRKYFVPYRVKQMRGITSSPQQVTQ